MTDFIFLFLAFFMINNYSDKPVDLEYRIVYTVDSVEFIQKNDNTYKFRIDCTVPNPCYEFSHIEVKQENNSLLISLFVKKEKNVNCIQVLGKLDHIIEVDVPQNSEKIIFKGKSNFKNFTILNNFNE